MKTLLKNNIGKFMPAKGKNSFNADPFYLNICSKLMITPITSNVRNKKMINEKY